MDDLGGFNFLPILGRYSVSISFSYFFFLTFLGTYRLTYYKSVVLRAPPSVLRFCVVLEVFIAIAIFAVSYYSTATTPMTKTIVSFETVDGYICSVLSPRSDSITNNSKNKDIVQFSNARFDRSACLNALSAVCSDEYRNDYFLVVGGVGSNDHNCQDIILSSNYRFCKTYEAKAQIPLSDSARFPSVDSEPAATYSEQYYFTNSSGTLQAQGNLLTGIVGLQSGPLSDFITDGDESVFIVQQVSSSDSALLHFSRSVPVNKLPEKLTTVGSANVYGVTYGSNSVYVLAIDGNMGRIAFYNMTLKEQRQSVPFPCRTNLVSSPGVNSRFISYGDDNHLYIICDNQIDHQRGSFSYLRMNAFTFVSSVENATISSAYLTGHGEATMSNITAIGQVLSVGKYLYFITTGNSNTNILQADRTLPANSLSIQKITNLGYIAALSAIIADNNIIYFPNSGNQAFYDVNTQSFGSGYTKANHQSYYLATYVKVGYSYQICNGNYSNYHVNIDDASSFADSCDDLNG
jgi:hypothetical protein